MHHLLAVKVLERPQSLVDDLLDFFRLDSFSRRLEFLKKVALFIIKNEIELIVVSERLPQIDDVRMPILRKHLDLSTDRLLCVRVPGLGFFESFDRY